MPEQVASTKEVVFVFLRNKQWQYGLVRDSDAGSDTFGMYVPPHRTFRGIDMDTNYTAHRAVWEEAGAYVEMQQPPVITMPVTTKKGARKFVYYLGAFQGKRGQVEKELKWFDADQIRMWAHNGVAGWVPEIMRVAKLIE
jgi:hypothetical protein